VSSPRLSISSLLSCLQLEERKSEQLARQVDRAGARPLHRQGDRRETVRHSTERRLALPHPGNAPNLARFRQCDAFSAEHPPDPERQGPRAAERVREPDVRGRRGRQRRVPHALPQRAALRLQERQAERGDGAPRRQGRHHGLARLQQPRVGRAQLGDAPPGSARHAHLRRPLESRRRRERQHEQDHAGGLPLALQEPVQLSLREAGRGVRQGRQSHLASGAADTVQVVPVEQRGGQREGSSSRWSNTVLTVSFKVSKYIPCIDRCITNSSYRTRDLAARASVSLMSESRLLAQLNENFNRIANANITDTECQGLLLQVRHIFQTMIYDQVPITHYLMQSKFLLAQVGQRFSHFTVTLYMDIVYMLLTK
jgi:hypothetical protein